MSRCSPYCGDIWRSYCCLTSFLSDCRYVPYLLRYSPTKLYDGAQMAIFCILCFQRAACSTFQTCILNSLQGHTTCGSMVDIQYPTAEIRRGKKETRKKKPQGKNIMTASATKGGHNEQLTAGRYKQHTWHSFHSRTA